MNKLLLSVATAALIGAAMSAQAASVGVSIEVAQPGVYGRIDIGSFPRAPAVVQPQPVVIQPPRAARSVEPVYLWVPPGHQKNWGKHCGKYNACGVPVYFVRDDWYQEKVMAPHQGRGNGHGPGKGKGHGKGRD